MWIHSQKTVKTLQEISWGLSYPGPASLNAHLGLHGLEQRSQHCTLPMP